MRSRDEEYSGKLMTWVKWVVLGTRVEALNLGGLSHSWLSQSRGFGTGPKPLDSEGSKMIWATLCTKFYSWIDLRIFEQFGWSNDLRDLQGTKSTREVQVWVSRSKIRIDCVVHVTRRVPSQQDRIKSDLFVDEGGGWLRKVRAIRKASGRLKRFPGD